MANVNNDTEPRDRSGYGKNGIAIDEKGPSPRKKPISKGAHNGQYDGSKDKAK